MYGRTALHIIATRHFYNDNPEHIESHAVIYLERRDENGEIALHYTVDTQLWNVVRMLLELGANLAISTSV